MTAIDRKSRVRRHNVHLTKFDPMSPLSVGNGEFAFTTDITGLQTFYDAYLPGIPLNTMAQWAWHSFPNTNNYELKDATKSYDYAGRVVPYVSEGGLSGARKASPAAEYLRANPHRISLARIGLLLRPGTRIGDVGQIDQTLDLWNGRIVSKFKLGGASVSVITAAHPALDGIAVRIESTLIQSGAIGIEIAFPAGCTDWRLPAEWSKPQIHTTNLTRRENGADFSRQQDDTDYHVRASWSAGGSFEQVEPHRFALHGADAFSIFFSPQAPTPDAPSADAAIDAAEKHWNDFWTAAGAIDLSAAADPRAMELERRIVLSEYQTAINCAGSVPPQETGLVMNSWFGKSHLEMHFWHAAHFALWGRAHLLERSLDWYNRILPRAKDWAQHQGFDGARWPKMVGIDGRDSPSDVGAFLIWQQPHPIYLAELVYRERGNRQTLQRFESIVIETAKFMASYARWDQATNRYVLGPVLIPAQESYGHVKDRLLNPTFELAYWHWALSTAQRWLERLGRERDAKWDHIIANLARPAIRDGVYAAIETEPYTITKDHPSMLQALGNLPPTPLIDPAVMSRTIDHVLKVWDWPSTWGWDYPVLAMCAARLGRPELAVDALLMDVPKNTYLSNGHNYQTERLPLYLPGNGGLLLATAMMAAGWEDGPADVAAPGFPKNWNARCERLRSMF